jgi:predicted lipoprotein with Yx(FWY)xxD motif
MSRTKAHSKEEMDVGILRGNSSGNQVRLFAIALLTLVGFVVAGHGSSSAAATQHSTTSVAVMTRKVKGLGVVLVNAKGRTLYTFAKDQRRHVTCTGSCANFWPPLKWKSAAKPKAGGSARSKLLGLDMSPSGGHVVTYNKWPLYTYTGDSAAGQANGQATTLNGGKWYVITPSGALVKHRA